MSRSIAANMFRQDAGRKDAAARLNADRLGREMVLARLLEIC